MNIYGVIGAIVGIIVGLIIAVIFFSKGNVDGKIKTQYDERQKGIRNAGYRYGFYTVLIGLVILILLGIGNVKLPVEDEVLYFFMIFIGIMVVGGYSVWNGAYWGINNDPKRYSVFFVIVTIINFAAGIAAIVNGRMVVDGILQVPFINLLCGVLFICLAVIIGIRAIVDKNSKDEEE